MPQNSDLNQIKEDIRMRLDIVSVVERYVSLKRTGGSFKGLCPFHKEKSPSFNVSPDKDIFHCFGCGKGGDVFTFLMEIEGVSFMEALTLAGREVGVTVELSKEQRQASSGPVLNRELGYGANGHAMNYFYEQMKLTAPAIEYFKKRGLSGETVRDFRLGFAPDSWDGLLNYLIEKGYSPQLVADAGLAVTSSRGGKPYDRFRGRIIFPILDMAGRPVAFGGRTMDPEGQPKYLNSPETALYRKNRVFYGLYQARSAIREQSSVIVVEGYMDMLMLYQAGVQNAVATCGTAMTNEHGHQLRRITNRVYLVFDGDSAGVTAAERAVKNLFPLEMDVRVVILPTGEDPDSLIQKSGADSFRELLNNASPAMDFYIEQLRKKEDISSPQGRSKIVGALAELLGSLQNEILKADYIRDISGRFGVEESLLSSVVKVQESPEGAGFDVNSGERERSFGRALRSEEGSLIHILIHHPETFFTWKDKITTEIFSDPLFRKLYFLILKQNGDHTALIDEIEDTYVRDLFSLMLIQKPLEEVDVIEHKVAKLNASIPKRKLEMITRQLAETTDFQQKQHLLTELVALRKALNGEK